MKNEKRKKSKLKNITQNSTSDGSAKKLFEKSLPTPKIGLTKNVFEIKGNDLINDESEFDPYIFLDSVSNSKKKESQEVVTCSKMAKKQKVKPKTKRFGKSKKPQTKPTSSQKAKSNIEINITERKSSKSKNLEDSGQKIVNLSCLTLSQSQQSILKKGLKFCPTQTRNDPAEARLDLENFHKKLRTKEFFSKQPENKFKNESKSTTLDKISPYGNTTNFLKLRQKSNWKPPHGSPNLETFINVNEFDLNKERSKINRKQNITNEERQAIKDLAKNKDITIKPADKGGAIVILNTTDYIKEAERQLSDKATYLTTDTDLTTKHQDIVNDTLEDMVHNGDITQKMANLLKSNVPRTTQIYFLPKIHKDIVPPPGRPIVSANGCPTEKISVFVDHFLNPIVKKMNTYIEDTSDFLRNIENLDEIKPNSIIGTMDVSSLYTNIPNEEGISCIKELLNEKRNRLEKPSNDSLTKLLRLVLTKNNFQFNGTNYIQIGGTAMGTRVAPSLANLFMNSLENKMIQSYDKKTKSTVKIHR